MGEAETLSHLNWEKIFYSASPVDQVFGWGFRKNRKTFLLI